MTKKTTETTIAYAGKAARLLADFDMVDCAEAEAIVYYRCNSAKRIVDRSTIVTPEMARYWKYSDWLYFVESAEEHYRDISRLSLDEVASVAIRFKMNSGSLGIFSVENTNLAKVDGFDRFLSSTPRTGKNHEIFYEKSDRTKIEDAHDALGVVINMGVGNLRPVDSGLPYICTHDDNG